MPAYYFRMNVAQEKVQDVLDDLAFIFDRGTSLGLNGNVQDRHNVGFTTGETEKKWPEVEEILNGISDIKGYLQLVRNPDDLPVSPFVPVSEDPFGCKPLPHLQESCWNWCRRLS